MSPPTNTSTAPAGLDPPWDDYRLLVESVGDYAIFMLDAQGRVASWNLGAERIKGYRASEIIGQHFSRFYPPEDIAAQKPERELESARRFGRVEDEGYRIRQDGTRFWANVVISVLRDEHGRVRGFAKITRDLTERRRTQEKLRETEERFRLFVESVADYALYMLDPEGRVTTWNLGAERMKGYRAAEIIGQHFERFFSEEDRQAGVPARELAVARTEGRYEGEGIRIRKDGTRFWANAVLTTIRNAQGEIVAFGKVTRDLTERRLTEETQRSLFQEQAARAAAEQVAVQAEEANRIKDQFLATVSHELRTPLHAILGWAKLLRSAGLEPRIAKGIDVIDRNATAQARIIEDLLDVSRIVTGKLLLEPVRMDLVAVTNEALEAVRTSAAAKELALDFKTDRPTHHLIGDPERLRQVIWNLLSNAVKFTDPKGSIHVRIEQRPDLLVLTVEDTGRGIDPDFLPFVFERFKQADATTTRRFGGLGLGLSLVRHIVELHGGLVAAASAGPGRGATFTVELPTRATLETTQRERFTPIEPRTGELFVGGIEGMRILVVDDDPDARELLTAALTRGGAAVETCGSTSEAMLAVKRFRPDLLVSDIGMPGEDGYALMHRLRALPREEGGSIPSIALTAYTREEDRHKVLEAGFTTYLAKPLNLSDLLRTVHNLAPLIAR